MIGRVLLVVVAVMLLSCGGQKIANYEAKSTEVSSSIQSDGIDSLIEVYRLDMAAKMNEKIGYTDSALVKFAPESPLSNFAADVVYARGMDFALQKPRIPINKTNSFCLLNFGGLRASINAGDITVGNIYELMPFENTIYIAELTYSELDSIYEYLYEMGGQPLSNCNFQLAANKKTGLIGGESLKRDSNFFVITSNYLFGGGDKMTFFSRAVRKWDTGILIRDAFMMAISKMKTLPYYLDEDRLVLDK